jgi:hypothetical protein
MPSRASIVLVLTVSVSVSVLAGCGSSLAPRPLTAAQASEVQRIGLGVVAVEAPEGGESYARILASMLERTRLFRSVLLAPTSGPAPQGIDYVATVTGRCSARHGGWIPWLPILTLGLVPQFHTMEVGLPFTLRQVSTREEVVVPCEIRSTLGIGWIPALLNVLPGWSLDEPEQTPNFAGRLAYAIVSRALPSRKFSQPPAAN